MRKTELKKYEVKETTVTCDYCNEEIPFDMFPYAYLTDRPLADIHKECVKDIVRDWYDANITPKEQSDV